ncbi:MAG: PEP-CTERM sorting domain-containing protein [Capsulimonas sp.]|uniref:PEP-CTERM sorting domain-containing protein n=1 Tax=Capsulimonas sp. TaxID=2494211 RepID=UPI003264D374
MRNRIMRTLALGTVLGAWALGAAAHADTTINFDDVYAGEVVNNTYSVSKGVSFVGEGGPFYTDVQTTDTTFTSAPNSLDGSHGAVDILFDSTKYGVGIDKFSIDLVADPLGYGSSNASYSFYDKNGALLFSLDNIDQTISQTLTFNGLGVQKVVLAGDANYDNLTFHPVPEPGTVAALFVGLSGLGALMLRRKRLS